MTTPGDARDLPTLSGFEEGGDEPDMGALLQRRTPQKPVKQTLTPRTAPQEPTTSSAPPAGRTRTRKSVHTAPGKDPAEPTPPAAAKPARRPAHSERANKIRSTSVHVPAPLLANLVAYREAQDLSNGDIVIAAIEYAHPRLGDLIKPPSRAGGSLFEGRTARSVRTTDGPLTPLNVRLFESDFGVLDGLVADYDAFSRGHLITVALTDFFAHSD